MSKKDLRNSKKRLRNSDKILRNGTCNTTDRIVEVRNPATTDFLTRWKHTIRNPTAIRRIKKLSDSEKSGSVVLYLS